MTTPKNIEELEVLRDLFRTLNGHWDPSRTERQDVQELREVTERGIPLGCSNLSDAARKRRQRAASRLVDKGFLFSAERGRYFLPLEAEIVASWETGTPLWDDHKFLDVLRRLPEFQEQAAAILAIAIRHGFAARTIYVNHWTVQLTPKGDAWLKDHTR